MSKKKIDNLGRPQPIKEEKMSNYIKGSIVEYLKNHGIKSENTTYKKLGQTKLIITNRHKNTFYDDSLETSIKYLKFKK